MRVMVTGSTGFIGSHLCRRLTEAGYTVRAFHRETSTLRLLEGLDVEHVVGDLTQSDSLDAALEGVDFLFHAAALMGGDEDLGKMYAVTVEGTRSLLKAAFEKGVKKVIYTSSVAALGVPEESFLKPPVYTLMDESHTWNFQPEKWPYGYSKYLAELEVQRALSWGLDAVIVNPSVVFGRGDIYRQTNSLIVQIAKRRYPGLVEGGINVVHIDDVIEGHLAALEKGKPGERYILGGYNMRVSEVLEMIADIVQVPAPSVVFPSKLLRKMARPMNLLKPFFDFPVSVNLLNLAGHHFYYDLHKAQTELGLSPPKSAEDAIADAYNWFVEMGALKK